VRELAIGSGEGWLFCREGGRELFGRMVEGPEEDDDAPDAVREPAAGGAGPTGGAGSTGAEGAPESEVPESEEPPGGFFLSPCYEIHRTFVPNQGFAINMIPYGLFAHTTRVLVTQPTSIVEAADLHRSDLQEYKKLVEGAEQQKTQRRASQSNIVLAGKVG
jgi:hypothetical protein